MWKKLALITAFLAMVLVVPAFCQEHPEEDLGYQGYICLQCPVCGTIYKLSIAEAENIDLESFCPSCHSSQIIDFEEVPCSWAKGEDNALNPTNSITEGIVEVEPIKNGTENTESQNPISVPVIGPEQNDETDYLIQDLSNEDPSIRKEAAFSLGDIGDPKAVDPLIGALKDEDAGVRYEAANALRRITTVMSE